MTGPRSAVLLSLCLLASLRGFTQAARATAVTRQYEGVIGAHESIEMTLVFDGGSVRGSYRPADSRLVGRLEGARSGDGMELRAFDPAGHAVAVLSSSAPRDGILVGTWESADGGRRERLTVEEVANDLPGGRQINGHYVRQGRASGGALDLLLLDDGRIKVQVYASWAGAGGAAGAGDVAGYAVFDGRVARLAGRGGCELSIEPIEGGVEVSDKGRCAGAFAGRYTRRSAVVPDWETFRWTAE